MKAGTLKFWEEWDGLYFEADLSDAPPNRARRVYELVRAGWITRCCLAGDFACKEYSRVSHPTIGIEVIHAPQIHDLALVMLNGAHANTSFVRAGAAPSPQPLPARVTPWGANDLMVRPVDLAGRQVVAAATTSGTPR